MRYITTCHHHRKNCAGLRDQLESEHLLEALARQLAASGVLVDTAPSETLALQQVGLIIKEHEKLVCAEGAQAEDDENSEAITSFAIGAPVLAKSPCCHPLTNVQ